eukprot:gene8225-66628_t
MRGVRAAFRAAQLVVTIVAQVVGALPPGWRVVGEG